MVEGALKILLLELNESDDFQILLSSLDPFHQFYK